MAVIDTSVIIRSYNNKKFLGRAIRSCLKQSLSPERYEIIVVDDASTDHSGDVLSGFKDRIKPIFLTENVGVAEAANIGIKEAVGSFVILVDSDDYINENTLLFMTEIMIDNPDIGFVYADHIRVDENEQPIEKVNINTLDLLLRHGAGIIFRKSYLEAIGLYDKHFRNAEDHELLKRYLKEFSGYHLRLHLYRYRQHNGNITKDGEARKSWEQKANDKNKNR